ncbi:unnamed protein product, partial [marine sediment metagenome]
KLETYGSDNIDQFEFKELESVEIHKLVKPTKTIANKDGRFFPYINTSTIELSKYQIYNKTQAADKKNINTREHCLIKALLECGVETALINQIKLQYIAGCSISKKDLSDIAQILKRDITLHYMDNTDKPQKKIYRYKPEDRLQTIHIALYMNHYFLFEKSPYSKYSITNYNEVKDIENFEDITRTKKNKAGIVKPTYNKNKAKISSLLLIHKLHEQKHFKKHDMTT